MFDPRPDIFSEPLPAVTWVSIRYRPRCPPLPVATVCMTPGFSGPSGISEPPPCSGTLMNFSSMRFLVDVAEMDIEELHAADLLQLFLDPAAGFQGIFQAPPHGVLVYSSFG